MADSIKINLDVATNAAEIALKNVKKATDENNKSWNIFKGNFAAGLALSGISAAYNSISGFVGSVLDEAAKAEQSVKNMNVALQQAGLYSAAVSEDFQNFADELERTTIYSGDAAEASVALFAALTNLDQNGIKSATTAAADLAATLGIDLSTASEMIAKAVNGNVLAFNKMGIEIQKGRTDSENLANTLSALSKQSGAAAEAANTYAGALAKAENQKGKLLETIGKLITTNPVVISGIEGMSNAFATATDFIERNKEEIGAITEALVTSIGIVGLAGAAWGTYALMTGGASAALIVLQGVAGTAWAAVTGPIGVTVLAIASVGVAVYAVKKYWDELKIATYEATAATLEFAANAVSAFSSAKAEGLRAQAQQLRDNATATRELIVEKQRLKQEEASQVAAEQAPVGNGKKNELEEMRRINAEKLVAKQEYNSNILLLEAEQDLQLAEMEAQHNNNMLIANENFTITDLENQLEGEEQRLIARQEFERQSLEASINTSLQKANLIEDEVAREKALRDTSYKANIDRKKLENKQEIELGVQKNKATKQLSEQQIADRKATWSTMLSLQNSNNKALAAAGKAFAIYDIAVNTPTAIGKALAAYPPPFNFAAAALVGAAMASQAAAVAGLSFETGGIVPGTSYTGDKVAANVNSREMILTTQQQAELFKIANGKGSQNQSSNSETNALLSELVRAVKSSTSIQIDGREIINVVKNGLSSGRSLA